MKESTLLILLPLALVCIIFGWIVLIARNGRSLDLRLSGLGVNMSISLGKTERNDNGQIN